MFSLSRLWGPQGLLYLLSMRYGLHPYEGSEQYLHPTVLTPNYNHPNGTYTRRNLQPTVPTPHITKGNSAHIWGRTHFTNVKLQQMFNRNKHYEHLVATNITNI